MKLQMFSLFPEEKLCLKNDDIQMHMRIVARRFELFSGKGSDI